MNETPSKEYDWNQDFAHDTIELSNNLNFAKEDDEENELMVGEEDACMEDVQEEAKRAELFEIPDQSPSNIERKMSMNGGYQFHHNVNQEAMSK